jgi:hypothetical protein
MELRLVVRREVVEGMQQGEDVRVVEMVADVLGLLVLELEVVEAEAEDAVAVGAEEEVVVVVVEEVLKRFVGISVHGT